MVDKKPAFFSAAIDWTPDDADKSVSAPQSIKIVARTSSIAYQGFWGKCVNNMSGFIAPAGPIPLDSCHDDSQVVGVADSLSIVNGDLIADARLIPFAEKDAASEIIFKGLQGVPYQASVNVDLATLEFHEVPDGQTEIVNGNSFSGPGYVFDKWTINGIAILPYGADSDTSVQFRRGQPSTVNPHDEGNKMTDPAQAVSIVPAVDMSKFISIESASKFEAAFGDKGAKWLLQGKTFEESASLFTADIKAEAEAAKAKADADLAAKDAQILALTTERDEFKAKAEFNRGMQMPVPVKPADGKQEEPVSKSNFGHTPGTEKLIAAIAARMPKAAPKTSVN